jgi:carbon monoxide dehydrogenase subunit G
MEMSGEQRIAAPRQRVWEALNDPEVLRQCIPGCQSLDKEADDRFNAVAEVKIGPIGARFKGAVTLGDLDPPNGYTITGQGNGGIAGNASGSAKVRLSDDAGGTLVAYDVDAQVGGRMAQLGGPIIDATAKQLAGKFFTRFGEIVGGEAAAPAAAEAAPPAAAAPAASVAAPAIVPALAPAPTSVQAGASPWGWVVALALAIVAGFMLGRSSAAEWFMVAIVLTVVVAAVAGYETGRRKGGQP